MEQQRITEEEVARLKEIMAVYGFHDCFVSKVLIVYTFGLPAEYDIITFNYN